MVPSAPSVSKSHVRVTSKFWAFSRAAARRAWPLPRVDERGASSSKSSSPDAGITGGATDRRVQENGLYHNEENLARLIAGRDFGAGYGKAWGAILYLSCRSWRSDVPTQGVQVDLSPTTNVTVPCKWFSTSTCIIAVALVLTCLAWWAVPGLYTFEIPAID
jgi:hypothetical protein